MNKIENIIVNGKTYKVQTLGVIETFQLHLEVGKYLGPAIGIILEGLANQQLSIGHIIGALQKVEDPENITKLQRKVFAQVITPKNTFLGDAIAIEEWFGENPNDLWEVFIKGLFTLVGEYLPNFANGKLKPAAKAASKSQKNTD